MRLRHTFASMLFALVTLFGCAESQEPADDTAPIESTSDELSLRLCAGPRGLTCGANQYCNARTQGICPSKEQYGVCAAKPSFCTKEYAPVCGCDGQTYGNACTAAAAGVAVSAKGECKPRNSCKQNADCGAKAFCQFAEGQCGGEGVCQPRSQICATIYKPVCGCDGRTYSNACAASGAGVSVDHQGACVPQGPFCGGFAGIPCEGGKCIDDPRDDCDPANGGADCGGICICPQNPCAVVLCMQGTQCVQHGCEASCEPVDDGCGGCGPGLYCCDPLHDRCVPVGNLCAL